eukprot:gene2879-17098_t
MHVLSTKPMTSRAVRLSSSSSSRAVRLAPVRAMELAHLAEADSLTLALGGGAAMVGLAGLLVATDPQRRRSEQMVTTSGNESEAKTLKWLDEEGGVEGRTVCDAGCGTGSLAIPLALRGATVSASDISSSMAGEAAARYEAAIKDGQAAPKVAPKFEAMGLEDVSGKYQTVTCLDVMIHYPQDRVDAMIGHLASLSDDRLIISFAPKTPAYSVLKRIGELFPGPSKATRAYLHAEVDVEAALMKNGFKVVKKEMTATNFYFSRLFEAVKA